LTDRPDAVEVAESVGAVAGPFEEIWHPAAHQARIVIQVQDERKVLMPAPGDPCTDIETMPPQPGSVAE